METVVHKVRGPDGKVHKVRGPKNAKPEQIIKIVEWKLEDEKTARERFAYKAQRQEVADRKEYAPTRGFMSNAAAGAGKVMTDAGLGIKDAFTDAFGSDESKAAMDAQIAEKRKIDAPLMSTGGGVIGGLAGGAAMMAPAMLLPGAATGVGAAVAGGMYGAAQPTMGDESRGLNTTLGAAGGAAGQKFANMATSRNAAAQAMMQSPKGLMYQRAREIGMKFDPAETNPTLFNRFMTGFSNRPKLEQRLSRQNQAVWNRIAREDLGLAPDVAITESALQTIRQTAGQKYKAISQMAGKFKADSNFHDKMKDAFADYMKLQRDMPGLRMKDIDEIGDFLRRGEFEADSVLFHLRRLRQNAEAHLSKGIGQKPNADELLKGRLYNKAAEALEDMVEENLKRLGRKDLFDAFVSARRDIAKSYTYEKALMPDGNIDIHKFGKALGAGKTLHGTTKSLGELAQAFPKITRTLPGSEDLTGTIGMGFGGAGIATGHPMLGAMAGAMPTTRAAITSPVGQALSNPYTSTMAQLGRGSILGSRPGQAMARGVPTAATGFWNPFEREQLPQQ